MSETEIRNEIIRVSRQALQLASQISELWDSSIADYVRLEKEEAA